MKFRIQPILGDTQDRARRHPQSLRQDPRRLREQRLPRHPRPLQASAHCRRRHQAASHALLPFLRGGESQLSARNCRRLRRDVPVLLRLLPAVTVRPRGYCQAYVLLRARERHQLQPAPAPRLHKHTVLLVRSRDAACCMLTGLSLHSLILHIYIAPFVHSYSINSVLHSPSISHT
jgi:hypothetical protein